MKFTNVFKMFGLAGLFALSATDFCCGMDNNKGRHQTPLMDIVTSKFDDAELSSSLSSMSVDDDSADEMLDLMTKLKLKFGYYGKKDEIAKECRRPDETNNTKARILYDLDQGWLAFDIMRDLVEAEKLLADTFGTSLTISEFKSIIELHKQELVKMIANFNQTENYRLFWLLVHNFCPNAKKQTKKLASKNNYLHQPKEWANAVSIAIKQCPLNVYIEHTSGKLIELPTQKNLLITLSK